MVLIILILTGKRDYAAVLFLGTPGTTTSAANTRGYIFFFSLYGVTDCPWKGIRAESAHKSKNCQNIHRTFPWFLKGLITMSFMPFPRTRGVTNARSTLLAPTVMIHGAGLDKVEGAGPEFPALHATTMLFLVAWSAPIAIPSLA